MMKILKKMRLVLFLFAAFLTHNVHAQTVCLQGVEEIPVLAGGRIKPLGVHAKEMVKFISGKSSFEDLPAAVVYCQMSLQGFDNKTSVALPIQVNHVKTREFLGIDQKEKNITHQFASQNLEKMIKEVQTLQARQDKSAFAKDLQAVLRRTEIYQDIIQGTNWTVPISSKAAQAHTSSAQQSEKDLGWISLRQVKTFIEEQSGQMLTAQELLKKVVMLSDKYAEAGGDRHLYELFYEKSHLFHWSILIALVSLAIVFISSQKTRFLVIISVSLLLLVQIAAIGFRVFISARAPVTNMYETVMWVGLGSLIFAIILSILRKEKLFLMGGIIVNVCCLFMMTFATDMLDPSIKPLVPVLRDNFWLSTHVTTITISYAAFALSWMIANYYLIGSILKKNFVKQAAKIGDLSYSAVKIGVVLLSAGIILGGIWADYSWGRFWGWDPKETWSLIALMGYIVILHGRFTGWINKQLFLPLIALAYLGVLMAWFGVNYILAAGLHSYGFSDGGAIFLGSIFTTQILIVIVYFIRQKVGSAAV